MFADWEYYLINKKSHIYLNFGQRPDYALKNLCRHRASMASMFVQQSVAENKPKESERK